MIYTSYYSKCSEISRTMTTMKPLFIQISNTTPVKVDAKLPRTMIPYWSIVDAHKRSKITDQQYVDRYLGQLKKSSFDSIQWKKMFDDNEHAFILLCYESPEKFCHRHILAKFLNEQFNITITEWHKQ